MRHRAGPWRRLAVAFAAAAIGLMITAPAPATSPGSAPALPKPSTGWRAAWGSAMAWQYGVAINATVRDIAQVTLGGTAVRIRLSNAFGQVPITFSNASIGLQGQGAALVPGTLRPITFGGRRFVTIPAGGLVYSDPVAIRVHAGQFLAVSLYVPGAAPVSVHPCCAGGVVSYYTPNGGGDQVANPLAIPFALSSPVWQRWLDAVDVSGVPSDGTIVVLGDSITDGFHSGLRWTDVLARRLDQLPQPQRFGVVNEGISANTLTTPPRSYALIGGGPPGLVRLQRDVLSQPGITDVVLFLGTNDLWFGDTATQLIQGMQQAIQRVHAAGLPIYGVTLLPRAGSELWGPVQEAYREQVNTWIRTSGAFNGVIDLAAVTANVYNGACNVKQMFPPYDSGDHLHPNPAGQTAMGNAINTALFGLPPVPTVPPLVRARPTAGCNPVTGAISAVRPTPTPSPTQVVLPSLTPAPRVAPVRPAADHSGLVLVGAAAVVALAVPLTTITLARRRRRRSHARILAQRMRTRPHTRYGPGG